MRTVLIVDDHAGFRRIARIVLERDGFDVVGEAADGSSALALVRALRPAVVLLDVQMPDVDGFAVADALQDEVTPPAIVLVSSRAATDYGNRVERSAAVGFIAKDDLSGARVTALLAMPCG